MEIERNENTRKAYEEIEKIKQRQVEGKLEVKNGKRKENQSEESIKQKKLKESDFLDELVSGLIKKETIENVAIIDLFGKLKKNSEGFNLSEEECKFISDSFVKKDESLKKGLNLMGKKHVIQKIEDDLLVCREYHSGVIVMKSSKHYIVSIYKNVAPTECSMSVHKSIQSMIKEGL
eukprot:TRINITY_DN369_c0_g1_i1.p1 TRINITY_DN369_c0_g1~~TRINITY_DN369_c0_g1_i1.p1  ORF type:complete len:177 (-),score=49.47 TRINITY_DN369_c0_g1_i1:80-610(-)